MKYSTTVLSLLICALLAFSVSAEEQSSSTIKINLYKESTEHWIAINIEDGGVGMTTAVQMQDSAEGASWADMTFVGARDLWVLESADAIAFPVSFRLTSKASQEIVLENILANLDEESVDTGAQFSAPRLGARGRKSQGKHKKPSSTSSPSTDAPTSSPSTKAPSTKASSTQAPSTKAPSTKAPSTKAPSTKAPSTKAPSTKAPSTQAPSTQAPTVTTKAPTVTTPKPSSGGSSGKTGLLVPLYMYPGAAWDTVAASGSVVPTVAIINPNSGPGSGPDSSFKTYMTKLANAKVEMIGYVHTSYGARSISDVKAEINIYASEFSNVVGIFLDEAAATADQVSYYTQVYQYIMSMPGFKYCVLNPGTAPVQAYFSISTQIVSFEDTVSKFASSTNPSYANASNKNHFSVISYGASQSQMQTAVQTAKSKGYYGWVYFTDNSGSATYNTLPSYYASMASTVAAN